MLSSTLSETKAIEKVPLAELKKTLATTYKRIPVPSTYKAWGIKMRVVDNKYYRNSSGIVNLRLLSNAYMHPKTAPDGNSYNIENPCKNFTTKRR